MNSMPAAGQLPPAIGRPPPRNRTTAIRISAPEAMRTEVKVAASIVVSLSASRHSRELPAKAAIVSAVSRPMRSGVTAARSAPSCIQVINLHRIVPRHLAPHVLGDAVQLAVEILLRVGPDTVGMRIVRAPHHIVLAKGVEQADADRIGLVGGVELPIPVVGGLHLE